MTNPLYFPDNVDTTTDFISVVNKNDVVVSTSELLNETTAETTGGLVGLSTNYIKAEKNKTDKKRICFKILKIRINDIYAGESTGDNQSQRYFSNQLGIDLPVIFLQDT